MERFEVSRALSVMILLPLVLGCANPFAPSLRGEGQSIFTDASTVGGMLENFVTTYELKDSLRYAELLAEDFQFQFYDPNTQRIDGWFRETDLSTTARLFRAYQNVSLIWGGLTPAIEEISTPDSLIDIRVQYQLRLDDIAPLHGFARFTLLKPAGDRFRILVWQDEF